MKTTIVAFVVILAALTSLTTLYAQTVLLPGDIKILKIGYEGEAICDPFYFKCRVALEPGTELYFTDCGVRSNGTFLPANSSDEGHIKLTVPEFYPAYLPFVIYAPIVSDWIRVLGIFGTSTLLAGDQIICYQGSINNPTFITAVNFSGGGWQNEAFTFEESTLPPGLTNGVDALALDRSVFTTSTAFYNPDGLVFEIIPGGGGDINLTDIECPRTVHVGIWPPSIGNEGDVSLLDIANWWSSNWGSIYDSNLWSAGYFEAWDIIVLPANLTQPPPEFYPWTIPPIALALYWINVPDTCPVELSSFTALATQQNFVQLDWITQSETEVLGFYIYRNTISNLESAEMVSPLIAATNTSQEQSYRFTDREVQLGTWYYWLQNMDMNGEFNYHGPVSATLTGGIDVPVTPEIPLITSIQSIYPNPFNPVTTIAYGLDKAGDVKIEIYNIRGQRISTLISGTMNAGNYRVRWNGMDEDNRLCTSGVYLVKMITGQHSATRKIILLK
ncbi:MAG: T9SS type A sorting domain-containing protein [Candidatus Cloacimonadaceae bacterium]|nr:T9SS type A sorting domain-containing protein [Candidatus Cloacimonadaceae bacterium]